MLLSSQLASFVEYVQHCKKSGCRASVKIEGEEPYAQDIVNQLLNVLPHKQVVLLPDVQSTTAISHQLQQLLGTEIDVLVINAHLGFNPTMLGIATGCIKAGGVFILLTPESWSLFNDPDYRRMTSSPITSGRFISHVESIFNDLPDSLFIKQSNSEFTLKNRQEWLLFKPQYNEQLLLVSAIKKVAQGRAKRPLVIQSDRGCGKSAALGIAAAELMLEKDCHIIVTASHFFSLATLFKHAALVCGMQWQQQKKLQVNNSILEFVASDQLFAYEHIDVLLIDEAASLPTPILKQFIKQFSRLVFATTVYGYEGNGRGFSLRFLPFLQTAMPQLRLCTLQSPLRYAKNDSLSLWVEQALLLAAWPIVECSINEVVSITKINRNELIDNKQRLQAIFGLLIEAHYQTSADDIRVLLDHPDVDIYVLENTQHIVAVAVLMKEGNFSTSQQEDLSKGVRRFQGHLLPQALSLGCEAVLAMRFARVVRIAVQSAYRRQGFAKQLINDITAKVDADFIGASFSAEESLIQFWQSMNMQVLRLGYQRESTSGEYACMMVKPLTPKATAIYSLLQTLYQRNMEYRLLAQTPDCSPALIVLLLSGCVFECSNQDREKVFLYLQLRCSFEVVQDALYRCTLTLCSKLVISEDAHLMLISKILLNQSWPQILKTYAYNSRAEAEKSIRQVLAIMLDDTQLQVI